MVSLVVSLEGVTDFTKPVAFHYNRSAVSRNQPLRTRGEIPTRARASFVSAKKQLCEKKMIRSFLGFSLVYVLINFFLAALGIGFGLLIRVIFPSIELGASIVAGIIVTGFSIHFFLRMLRFAGFLNPIIHPDLDDSEDDFDTAPVNVYPPRTSRSPRKRKRK
jgi:hypothetical protein